MAEITRGWPPDDKRAWVEANDYRMLTPEEYREIVLLAAVGRALLALRKLDAERVDPHATHEWIVRRDAAKRALDQAIAAWEAAGGKLA